MKATRLQLVAWQGTADDVATNDAAIEGAATGGGTKQVAEQAAGHAEGLGPNGPRWAPLTPMWCTTLRGATAAPGRCRGASATPREVQRDTVLERQPNTCAEETLKPLKPRLSLTINVKSPGRLAVRKRGLPGGSHDLPVASLPPHRSPWAMPEKFEFDD